MKSNMSHANVSDPIPLSPALQSKLQFIASFDKWDEVSYLRFKCLLTTEQQKVSE